MRIQTSSRAAACILLATAYFSVAADNDIANRTKIAALAKLPLSSGSGEPLELLRAGLVNSSPGVRAAAARVAHVMSARELLPGVRTALAQEADPDAAHEEAWLLADLDETDESDALFRDALAKPLLKAPLLHALIAGRGPRILPFWAEIKVDLEASPTTLPRSLGDGLHEDAGTMMLSLTLRDHMDRSFVELLDAGHLKVNPSVVTAALGAPSETIRSAAYAFLAELSGPLRVDQLPERPNESLSTRERVHRLLFESARGLPRSEPLEDLARFLSGDKNARSTFANQGVLTGRAIRGLSSEERERLLLAAGVDPAKVASAKVKVFADSPPVPATNLVIRTVEGHPPDFIRAVLEATGCKGGDRMFDGTDITFGAGGRAVKAAALPALASAAGCGEASRILGATLLGAQGDARVAALLPENREFLSCISEEPYPWFLPPELQSRGVGRSGRVLWTAGMKPPDKLKGVLLLIPGKAPNDSAEGSGTIYPILQVGIGRSGCVTAVRVLRSAGAASDRAALDSVSSWKYWTTKIDGQAVPVNTVVFASLGLTR